MSSEELVTLCNHLSKVSSPDDLKNNKIIMVDANKQRLRLATYLYSFISILELLISSWLADIHYFSSVKVACSIATGICSLIFISNNKFAREAKDRNHYISRLTFILYLHLLRLSLAFICSDYESFFTNLAFTCWLYLNSQTEKQMKIINILFNQKGEISLKIEILTFILFQINQASIGSFLVCFCLWAIGNSLTLNLKNCEESNIQRKYKKCFCSEYKLKIDNLKVKLQFYEDLVAVFTLHSTMHGGPKRRKSISYPGVTGINEQIDATYSFIILVSSKILHEILSSSHKWTFLDFSKLDGYTEAEAELRCWLKYYDIDKENICKSQQNNVFSKTTLLDALAMIAVQLSSNNNNERRNEARFNLGIFTVEVNHKSKVINFNSNSFLFYC